MTEFIDFKNLQTLICNRNKFALSNSLNINSIEQFVKLIVSGVKILSGGVSRVRKKERREHVLAGNLVDGDCALDEREREREKHP